MLEQFAARGVNLSRIESRPSATRPGEYSFSVDALAHIDEARMAEVLVGLKRTCPARRRSSARTLPHMATSRPLAAGTSDDDFDAAHAWVEALRRQRVLTV